MSHYKPRGDAEWHHGRRSVPTVYGQTEGNTKWISDWNEFLAVGGITHFNEDQTEIYLTLPESCKFSIKFGDALEAYKSAM